MADISAQGTTLDERAKRIRKRRLANQINAMENTADKYEIDILDSEAQIERLKETISATRENIGEKRDELEALEGSEDV